MTWLHRYRVRHYLGSSIWIYPVLSTLAAIGAVHLLHWIELETRWVSPVDPETARAVLGTMASALFTAIVFVCSALLVAVQLASAQLTPRIIGIVFRDPVTKFSLTLLAFTFTFTLAALIRIKSVVPLLTTHVAAYDCLVSLAVFFYLIDHLGQALRPSGALRVVAGMGARSLQTFIPSVLPSRKTGQFRLLPTSSMESRPRRSPTPRTVWYLLSILRDSFPWPSVRTASSKWFLRLAIIWPTQTPCSGFSRAVGRFRQRRYANRLPLATNAPSSRTRHSRCGSWSISPRRRFHRQSTTRQRQFSPWTRSITSSAMWAIGILIQDMCETPQAGFDSSIGHRIGKISCVWPLPRSVTSAARASRSPGACVPCLRI